jgi:hypothetical protein
MRCNGSMRGAGAATLADRPQNYFFFSAGFFSAALSVPIARGHRFGGGRRHFFLFRARHGHGHHRNVFITQNFDARGHLDFTEVNGFPEFEMADINHDLFRQILGQGTDPELEQDVFEHAAAVLNAGRFADGLDRYLDNHLFVLGHLMQIDVQDFAVEGVMLNFLDQREAFGARIVFHRQIHEQIFRGGMVDELADFPGVDFEVLRFGLAAVNDRRHATCVAQFLDSAPSHLRPGIRF